MIYHLTQKSNWDKALTKGFYDVDSLYSEGFIHCCEQEQVHDILERYFKQESNILLLTIDKELLQVPVKYELAPSVNQLFPHVFGPINIDAVTKVILIKY